MKPNIFIPKEINVGFQNRQDTYTGKLAYIIYFDEKGKLRKERSWENWRDKDIENKIHTNEPTSGFVLNKKTGDYISHWNHRQAYVRVYDPRGFEFEVTIENLLYLLENASSIKGKGLEGEFVYAWDKADLLLLPVDSPDYKDIKAYTDILNSNLKLKGKDLKPGATYLTKDNEEWVYLGRYDKWETDYSSEGYIDKRGYTTRPVITKGKVYFFWRETRYGDGIETIKSLNKFISVVSEDCVENYADLMDKLEHNSYYSPVDRTKDKYIPYTFDEIKSKLEQENWGIEFYDNEGEWIKVDKEKYGNSTENLKVLKRVVRTRSDIWGNHSYWGDECVDAGDMQDIFEKYQPHYLNIYLANGKLYQEGK